MTEGQALNIDAPTACSSNPGTAVSPSMPGYPGFMGGWPGVSGSAAPFGTHGNSGFYGFSGFPGFGGSSNMFGSGGGLPTGSNTAGSATASSPGFGGFPGFGGSSGFGGPAGFGGFPGFGAFPSFFGSSPNPSPATHGGSLSNACTPVRPLPTEGENLEDAPKNAKADLPQPMPNEDRPADNLNNGDVNDSTAEYIDDAPQAPTAATVHSPTAAPRS
jgi:hypothetical protein